MYKMSLKSAKKIQTPYTTLMVHKPVILGGEFSCIVSIDKDKLGGSNLSGTEGSMSLHNLTNDYQLLDAFRYAFPNKTELRWTSRGINCRLDRICRPTISFSFTRCNTHFVSIFRSLAGWTYPSSIQPSKKMKWLLEIECQACRRR